ncbi:MAG: hypothetical protein HOO06_01010 [Bdellovibrionaceae bacterium]|jgi:hypothetical protein|nr:hypothetical protein [Pseudobdellovibrionaceae bacterium]
MNRSIIYFIALFSLGAGWGHAILTDNNLTVSAALGTLNYLMGNDEDISKDIVRTAPDTKILKIVKTDKARQVRKNSKIRRIQPEQFKGSDLIIRDEETQRRISKIEAMVDSSIKEDEKSLVWLNQNEEKVVIYLEKLYSKKQKLRTRMEKLNKIAGIFAVSKKAEKIQQMAYKKDRDKLNKKFSIFLDAYGENNAEIISNKKNVELNINADNLLIHDLKRKRISEDISQHLVKFIDHFKDSSKSIDEIILVKANTVSERSVKVIKTYLYKQFGWDVTVVPAALNSYEKFPVSLKLVSVNIADKPKVKVE